MPILILLGDTKQLLPSLLPFFKNIDVHKDEFTHTKSVISNMLLSKLYILLNCDLKPYRYEIYCLAKKQGSGYCILSTSVLSGAKHDNPNIITSIDINVKNDIYKLIGNINTFLNIKLRPTTAHRKKLINNNNYLSTVKIIINKVNEQHRDILQTVKKDIEYKLIKMISLNPVNIEEIENLYKEMMKNSDLDYK